MSAKIDRAADATTTVQGHVATALDALNDYRIDDRDVFVSPAARRASLLAAQAAIAAALKVMDSTSWPGPGEDGA